MKYFDSRRIAFLLEHGIDPCVMKKWNCNQVDRLDNLIKECQIAQHTTIQRMYYWINYNLII